MRWLCTSRSSCLPSGVFSSFHFIIESFTWISMNMKIQINTSHCLFYDFVNLFWLRTQEGTFWSRLTCEWIDITDVVPQMFLPFAEGNEELESILTSINANAECAVPMTKSTKSLGPAETAQGGPRWTWPRIQPLGQETWILRLPSSAQASCVQSSLQ